MRFLLTSAGIKNKSISDALVGLLGKPFDECSALCIPTAAYGHPLKPGVAWKFVSGQDPNVPMCGLGWKTLGAPELAALPSIDREQWVALVKQTDVLLANGGDALFLTHWMRESGLAKLLPSLGNTVYVGLSAGSLVMTPRIGEDFVYWKPPAGGDEALGIVDFSISRMSITSTCPTTRWPTPNGGRRGSAIRRTRSTTTPRSRSPTARSRSFPRDTGSC